MGIEKWGEVRSCENCYYQAFDERAYPCSRCIHNKPSEDKFRARISLEQLETEALRALIHAMIDNSELAEEAYPDLRQRLHDAVDAVQTEPKRGDWIYDTDGNCKCSECLVSYGRLNTPYCPNCGAEMTENLCRTCEYEDESWYSEVCDGCCKEWSNYEPKGEGDG